MSSGWKIPKDALETCLNVLLAVPSRHGMETSEYIKFEKHNDNVAVLSLSAEMSGVSFLAADKGCPFKEPVCIDRRMFQPFVAAGKELAPGYYVLKMHEKGFDLRHGHRHCRYTSNKKSQGYNKIPKIDSKPHALSEEVAAVLTCARHVAVDDPVAPHLSCVYIYPKGDRLIILSANAHQFFKGDIKLPKHFHLKKAALPLPLIDAAKTENTVELLYSDKLALLKFSCGTLWHPVKSEARKKFPHSTIESMIKKGREGETLLHVYSSALYDSASRADSYISSVTADEPILKLETKKGDLEIRLKCKASGADFVEQIKLNKPSKGDVDIDWPLKAIKPILEYAKKSGEARIAKDDVGRTCFIAGHITMLIARPEKKKKREHSKKKKDKKK